MDRINGAGHVARMFVSEDVATNRPPTEITDVWLNGMQEEIVTFVEEQGLVPSNVDYAQLAKAIKKLFQKSSPLVPVTGGTADAITGVYTPGITALTNGMTLYVRAGLANSTTTPTFTPASGTVAAKTIVKGNGVPIVAGDIAGAGHWLKLQYDVTLDKWVLLNPASPITTKGLQRFTSNGNFTVPAGVSTIYVSGCAGGGGGGSGGGSTVSASNYGGGGGGGGAGQSQVRTPYAVTPGQVISITIGGAGSPGAGSSGSGATGTAGGSTVVGGLVALTGGAGGVLGNSLTSGFIAGGGAGAGYPSGSSGTDGQANTVGANGGAGGSSPFGGGGGAGRGANGAGMVGAAAIGFGGGGGGGGGSYVLNSGIGGAGGAGAPGLVIIEW